MIISVGTVRTRRARVGSPPLPIGFPGPATSWKLDPLLPRSPLSLFQLLLPSSIFGFTLQRRIATSDLLKPLFTPKGLKILFQFEKTTSFFQSGVYIYCQACKNISRTEKRRNTRAKQYGSFFSFHRGSFSFSPFGRPAFIPPPFLEPPGSTSDFSVASTPLHSLDMANLARFVLTPCSRNLLAQWQRPASSALWANQVRKRLTYGYTEPPQYCVACRALFSYWYSIFLR